MPTAVADALATARGYLTRGWAAIRVPLRSKNPGRKNWQSERWAADELPRRFSGRCNIGVLTGEPSGWLVDVDLDHALAFELAKEFLLPTDSIFGRNGKPRSHWLYIVTAPIATHKRQVEGAGMLVELRSTGCQTVFPGSIHESGEPIEWASDGHPALVPPHILRAAVDRLADQVEILLGIRRESPGRNGGSPNGKAHDHNGRDRALVYDAQQIVKRAKSYISRIPAASEGSRNHTAFKVAAILVNDFALPDDDAWPLLGDWNQGCKPPLPEGELRTTFLSAHKSATRPKCGKATEERPQVRRASKPLVVGEPAKIDVLAACGRTDSANGRRFVAQHGENVRWCDPWRKWFVWDGRRWEVDSRRRAEMLAKQTADSLWQEVGRLLPDLESGSRTALVKFASETADARGIGNMLAMAKSELPILPEQLDAHPWLFNCGNGTVDLRTGIRLAHDREHYITKICPHDYVTGAEGECPLWQIAIDRVLGGNPNLVGFFRRYCGSAMVGEVIEHILAILWGRGSNGKSLVVEILLAAMGPDYADKGAPDLLLASKYSRHPTELADLHGKRLIVCTETEEGRRLAESAVKMLSGGDTVKARRMKEDFWSFRPSHSLLLVTNHMPVTRGTDDGIWRRLRLVPFVQRFWDANKGESGPEELQADPYLKEKLRPELPGIVRWLIDSCLEWQKNGLGQPKEVTVATADYRHAMDTIAEFLDECCDRGEGLTVKASDVRNRYSEWCKENNEKPLSGRRLGEYLAENGVAKRVSNGTWYSGVVLK